MLRQSISVTIITLNEEANLLRCLESIQWADDVVVVDSGSTDRTLEIAREWGARVLENPWPGYGKQKNFAQAHARHDWVLNLDADEVVSRELQQEIESALNGGSSSAHGYLMPRKTFYLGKWIRHGGWYPNSLARLANKNFARWSEPHVHERLLIDGPVAHLQSPIHHYTFRSIADQVRTNLRYARFGALDARSQGRQASLIRLIFKPWIKFAETYLWKRGFLDGLAGFIISVNAAHSVFMKEAFLFEKDSENP